jgi:RNA polymerase sigma-70 factor (sigma-E family)
LTTAIIDTLPDGVEDGGTRVLQQDRDAFDAFVRARLPHLLRLGRALTGSEHAAADLVQDALERSLMRWSRIESDDPEGYVRRVMVTRNISAWRRVRRERLIADVPETSYDDPQADPALWAALAKLPPRQRAVIALRYYEDLTEAQIAAVLGCARGTVKSQSAAAIGALRRALAASGVGEAVTES